MEMFINRQYIHWVIFIIVIGMTTLMVGQYQFLTVSDLLIKLSSRYVLIGEKKGMQNSTIKYKKKVQSTAPKNCTACWNAFHEDKGNSSAVNRQLKKEYFFRDKG